MPHVPPAGVQDMGQSCCCHGAGVLWGQEQSWDRGWDLIQKLGRGIEVITQCHRELSGFL